uniref:C-type lectin domain-containing protein n=1 Tax=Chelonoidis abingdonii TaxID=106734 RepID=A0A8C0J1T5_CHEAB
MVLAQQCTLTFAGHPRCPRWHRLALGLTLAGNVVLLGVGSSCKLCPKDWLLHGDKCYWVSKGIKGWEWSREDCLMKRAQLLVIDDWKEMAFVRNNTQNQHQVWIGLNITSPGRTWTWQDGSPLNQTQFPVFDPAKENNCASVKKNKIHSEICQTELKWICSKAAVLV